MSSETLLWVAFCVVAALASAGFFTRLRYKLRRRPTYRPSRDGWQRGFPHIMGLCVSVLALGVGLGGALFSRVEPPTRPAEERVLTPPPTVEEESSAAAPAGDPARTDSAPAVVQPPVEDEPEATEPPGDPLPSGEPFAVRVGVFGSSINADAAVAALAEAGFQPLMVRRTGSDGSPLYFVYADTYPTREEAESAAELVRALGNEAMVVEIRDPAGI